MEKKRAVRKGTSGAKQIHIVSESTAMKEALEDARFAAIGSDRPILIVGEIGVGKSHLARYIHSISPRSGGPLTCLNCGSISNLENLLFGHREGVFTGAVSSMKGRLELTHGGVLILDDVDRLSLKQQDLFHRVVVDGEIVPLGQNKPLQADFRLISTTNKNLAEEAHEDRFHRDFLSRINFFEVRMPPLRERLADLPGLVEFLFQREISKMAALPELQSTGMPHFHRDFWPALKSRDIPDNVRGLEKIVAHLSARVVAGRKSELTSRDLDEVAPVLPAAQKPSYEQHKSLREFREEKEKRYIEEVIRHTSSNVRQSARILGVSPKHLYTKLRRYGIAYRE